MKKTIFFAFMFLSLIVNSQNLIVSDDSTYTGTTGNALFEVYSANGNKGVLIPRLTTAQRTSISTTNADEGLVVYDTETHSFWVWSNNQWVELGDKQTLSLSGNTLSITNGNSILLPSYSDSSWSLYGNSISNGQFLGTVNNQDLIFKTNDTIRSIISSNGKVGIGTNTPSSMLQVVDRYDTTQLLTPHQSVNSRLPGISVYDNTDFIGMGTVDRDNDLSTTDDADGMIYWGDNYNSDLRFIYMLWDNSTRLIPKDYMIIKNTGDVGIGTTTPQGKLDVKDVFYTEPGQILIRKSDNTNEGGQLSLLGAGTYEDIYLDNYQGNLRVIESTGTESLVACFTKDGNVGIGTADPQTKLQINNSLNSDFIWFDNGTTNPFRISFGNDLAGVSDPDGVVYFEIGGNETYVFGGHVCADNDGSRHLGTSTKRWEDVWAVNGTIQTSDLNDKTNIKPLSYGLKEVLKLNPIAFKWKKDNLNYNDFKIGFSAQELQKVIPEVVVQDKNHPDASLGVMYSDIIPVLVNAIKEQQSIINKQQTQIEQLKKQNEEILKRLNNLENK